MGKNLDLLVLPLVEVMKCGVPEIKINNTGGEFVSMSVRERLMR